MTTTQDSTTQDSTTQDTTPPHRDTILIEGARANNLKDVCLRIPKERIVVFTGVSGSGKSSIVFDTVAVESQRQLGETLSWFARDRLPKHERPAADVIDHLTPAVVVDQRPIGGNSRSTVGTITDILAVLRVLFSRCGQPAAGEASAFSFNDPQGMCTGCDGLGQVVGVDLDAFLDTSRSLNEGAVLFEPFKVGSWHWQLYAESGLFDPDKPLRDYTEAEWDLLLHGKGFRVPRRNRTGETGSNPYEGLVERFERLYLKRDLDALPGTARQAARRVVTERHCPDCHGARLNAAALACRIAGRNIAELCALEVSDLIAALTAFAGTGDPVGAPIAAAAIDRLRRLEAIGLPYLSLDRPTSTLSGGEAQRLKVVRHLGSSLTGLTYIFDEPSTGMHPRDVGRLNGLLRRLRDKGNTVLVVEHDPDVIANADHVIDMGPGAGARGGRVVFEGPVDRLRASGTLTGRRLRRPATVKPHFRTPTGRLTVTGARLNNLKDVTVDFPTGVLTAVTGVAGSGKSTLVSQVFAVRHPEAIVVDQSPIGASRRSTPATYIGVMDPLRRLFAKAGGADPALFSHNSKGACPGCDGHGVIVTDLAFMDPVTTTCRTCRGSRYRPEALAHTLRGRTIVDVLAMTAREALDLFTEEPLVTRLRALDEVGLGYLALGQPLGSLSGGERQRVKLAHQLHRTGQVYVLDEPTTGLHMADVDTLVALLDRLVDAGNTVIVIEHDLDVVRRADWVIDLGPDGGKHGGEIVFTGTPAALLEATGSITAAHLRKAVSAAPDGTG
ncbi:excinuclease ABC subunit UvrA [Actinomadura viridis]|uniref:UvrABC system protein A n=1 Tax=Actinomadura viridis TaxID=58110 RepID=A0A931DJ45_9ACTN|nr:excinuclease ABC subunit UvrA [Actinomadura viridis]MBG6089679.1 excinuclease UvrABC ATPase subunit [Actinomadura viridis]